MSVASKLCECRRLISLNDEHDPEHNQQLLLRVFYPGKKHTQENI